ncbi:MAG: response regulator [Lachnospiraceae bacterium]
MALIFLVLIIFGFSVYLNVTSNRTIERNAKYIEDAADQTAKRIDDLLVSAENSINAIADMYEKCLDPTEADVKMLEMLTESTVFDYIGYVDADGIYTDYRGLQADVSDRDYYREGMKGNTGMDMVFNGRVSGEDLVIFYAPVRDDGEVVGILSGRYRQQKMSEIITSTYFGEPANTYLCLSDGTVIASSNEEKPENILDDLSVNEGADKEALKILTDALTNGKSVSFTYSNSYGSNSACVTGLSHSKWMMLQVFPMSVTDTMLKNARDDAFYLLLWLLALSAVYILLILLENGRENKRLSSEKDQLKDIVNSTSGLFIRYILVDLEHDTYVSLTNKDLTETGELSEHGVYSELCDFWSKKMPDKDPDGDGREQFRGDFIRENLTEDIPYLQFEKHVNENDVKWAQISVMCLKRNKGVPASVLMAVQNVTQMKETEIRSRAAIEDAYRSASAANDAKRLFLFDMSHDMRTPMNAVIGLSGLLERDAGDPEKVRSHGQKINAAGQQLMAMINEILDMSKIESGKTSLDLSAFALSDLVEDLNAVYMPQANKKGQHLRMRVFDVTEDRLLGDKMRLSEVFGNLLSNAINYSGEGGQISFTVYGLEKNSKGFAHLRFEVADDGIGMSPEFAEKIFDPFSRENNSTVSGIQGIGLGMTIVKSLVDLMGGMISVESVRGKGTTVNVELELRETDGGGEPEFWMEHGISTALILGPDEKICGSIGDLMSGTGVDIRYITDRKEALESQNDVKYDLILLDRVLPDMEILESVRSIRERYGNKPALILIDNDWIAIEEDAKNAGVNGFLPAPFAMSTLKREVSCCITSREREKEASDCIAETKENGKEAYDYSVVAEKSEKDALDFSTIAESKESEFSFEGLRVLMAEDNEINAEILMTLLEMEGAACECAVNGREAVEMFEKSPVSYFDAVLMDIQMPEMNGYEAARAIRKLSRPDAGDIPIVAMTANAFSDDIKNSKEAGMNAHLFKPVDIRVLKGTMAGLFKI